MARFGTWKPLGGNWASQQRMTQVDIVSIHTMVGSLAGTDAMFRRNGFGGTFSHFGIGGNGECTQWQDTAYRAAANYAGNWHIVSVECADLGAPFAAWNTADGSAVPAFTAAQVETLAQLIAAMCQAHSIPCALIPDAKPGRRGIGYHRQGVPGYMVAGAEQWSTATGKVCPGNRRIAQIPQIITRAQAILAGATAPEDDMPSADEIATAIGRYPIRDGNGRITTLEVLLAETASQPARIARAVIDGLLDEPIHRDDQKRGATTLRAILAWSDTNTDRVLTSVADVVAGGSSDMAGLAKQVASQMTVVAKDA